jgi:hypothetical protein
MHIEFLVEEPSSEAALKNLVPRFIGNDISFNIHVFQGKQDLLVKLPDRLKGYRSWLPGDWYIIVLIDQDGENCLTLKQKLEKIAHDQGLITRSNPKPNGKFQVINRLAIEELEAWFFGDVTALNMAYKRVSSSLDRRTRFRNPDAIHNTAEALERVLNASGYYRGGMPKIEVARRITEYMDPNRNTSKSFRVFRDALIDLIT